MWFRLKKNVKFEKKKKKKNKMEEDVNLFFLIGG